MKNKYELDHVEKNILNSYIDAGRNKIDTSKNTGYSVRKISSLINSDLGKRYLDERSKLTVKAIDINKPWKIQALGEIVLDLKMSCLKDDSQKVQKYNCIISAISELNKMQGDHAATKSTNFNVNTSKEGLRETVNELSALMEEFKIKNKQEC